MKSYPVLMVVFLLLSISGIGQNYYVITVEGKVYRNELQIKTGDKLTPNDVIKFTAENDKVYILSPEKGNFVLVPPGKKQGGSPEWITALENAAIPQNKFYKTATRGSENNSIFNDIYDLMGFFRDKVTIIEEAQFKVNSENIRLDDRNYLEIRTISDSGSGNPLRLGSETGLFRMCSSVTGITGQKEYEMDYIQGDRKIKIGTFQLMVKSKSEISDELAVIYAHTTSSDPSLVYFEQVLPFISQSYGNTSMDIINEIISLHFIKQDSK